MANNFNALAIFEFETSSKTKDLVFYLTNNQS